MFNLDDLKDAQALIYRHMPKTPEYSWPLLNQTIGNEVWVKHENHTPVGAFKIRGGLVYLTRLAKTGFKGGVISATRGNHGQSLALAGQKTGIAVTIIVPKGNSVEKNNAMKALGAKLIIHGEDFEAARIYAGKLAVERNLHPVPAFHKDLVNGVATYAYEFLSNAPKLDMVYVGVGMGSGICGLIKTRDLLGLDTKIIGVVAKGAPAYARSFEKGVIETTKTAATFADGVACRVPDANAFEMIKQGADHIVQVSDDDIKVAIKTYFKCCHNIAEGAGAIGLAGAMVEAADNKDLKIGTILSGGNIDMDMFAKIITE